MAAYHALNVASNALLHFFIILFEGDTMHSRLEDILSASLGRREIPIEDCVYLLSFPEDSPEAGRIIEAASGYALRATGGVGRIAVQIGIISGPCYADCEFCVFRASSDLMEQYEMSASELTSYLRSILDEGKVSAVSLMSIADFDFRTFLDRVQLARSMLPPSVKLFTNTGDLSFGEAACLKEAGVDGAYHAIRLGEGIVNMMEPLDRFRTQENLKTAEIPLYTGVEPIGPEHTPEEIARAYYDALSRGCAGCSASAREPVPGTPMYGMGSVSPRRLRQIRSALLLCSTSHDTTELGAYGGFYGGFGWAMAEYAGSPKDVNEVSENGLGRTVGWAAEQLRKEGFTKLLCSDGKARDL